MMPAAYIQGVGVSLNPNYAMNNNYYRDLAVWGEPLI